MFELFPWRYSVVGSVSGCGPLDTGSNPAIYIFKILLILMQTKKEVILVFIIKHDTIYNPPKHKKRCTRFRMYAEYCVGPLPLVILCMMWCLCQLVIADLGLISCVFSVASGPFLLKTWRRHIVSDPLHMTCCI